MQSAARRKPDFSKQNQSSVEIAYRFDDFELYPLERLLKRSGAPISVQPKVFDALLLLVSRARNLVSNQELIARLWPDVHVSERNLTNTIVSLRKVLGRDAIRTVSKHGYRFEAELISEPGVSRELYERFLRARQLIEGRSLEHMQIARDLLWICLAEDPAFAQGWAWLGRCCWFLDKFGQSASSNSDLASSALKRALALDPDLTDAQQFATFLEVDTGRAAHAVQRLFDRLKLHPGEPEVYASLVQALRFQGLLQESAEAHRRAVELDPDTVTSVAHTLFFSGDFASAIEAYSGRAAYYLDVAAWAALGLKERAIALLRQRMKSSSLSRLMTSLLSSLLAALEGRKKQAVRDMESAEVNRDPEILVFFARHYSFLGLAESAAAALQRAAEGGFLCAPETLREDPWFASLRGSPHFARLLRNAEASVKKARSAVEAGFGDAPTTPGPIKR